MSYLHISQSAAEAFVALHLPQWGLLAFSQHPPHSDRSRLLSSTRFDHPIILMTVPIILAPLHEANFDIVWYGMVMTIAPYRLRLAYGVWTEPDGAKAANRHENDPRSIGAVGAAFMSRSACSPE
jgi:hypothetical protein